MKSYLVLALFLYCVFTSTAFSQDAGKKPGGPTASTAAETSKTITGKARVVRSGEQSEASHGSASDVQVKFFLSDDKKSIVKISVFIVKVEYGYKTEGASSTGSASEVNMTEDISQHPATKGDFELGEGTNCHIKGRFTLPAEAKGTLHLFYTTRQQQDYQFQEFKFDLGEWEFDAK